MAQTGGVLALRDVPENCKRLVFFAAIEKARFRRPVVPGDQLRLELEVLSRRTTFCQMKGKAFVDGRLAAEAVILCKVIDNPGEKSP
jgi:3-hydroxyacyl-[acyl-carrier-protein] dehydratase